MRDSFIVYRSFYEASKNLPAQDYKEFWNSLLAYALDEEEPKKLKSEFGEALLTMAKPQIDANKKRQDAGIKGGRPKKSDSKSAPKRKDPSKGMLTRDYDVEKIEDILTSRSGDESNNKRD